MGVVFYSFIHFSPSALYCLQLPFFFPLQKIHIKGKDNTGIAHTQGSYFNVIYNAVGIPIVNTVCKFTFHYFHPFDWEYVPIIYDDYIPHNKKKQELFYYIEDIKMIIFDKLWETMKIKGISTYVLIEKYNIDTRTIRRLKAKNTTTDTLNKLFDILDCNLENIATHI